MTTLIQPGMADLVGRVEDLAIRVEKLIELTEADRRSRDSLSELVTEAGEVSGLVMESAIRRIDELEKRGYFAFGTGLLEVLDRIVTSFDEEDIRQLGNNVVLILETVKQMTQPEIMLMLQRTARIAREGDEPESVSLFRLLRELRDPEVKLGLHRAMSLLRGLGSGSDSMATREEEKP